MITPHGLPIYMETTNLFLAVDPADDVCPYVICRSPESSTREEAPRAQQRARRAVMSMGVIQEFPGKYRVIEDPTYGYRRLDPIPEEREIAEFYKSDYYALVRQGGRAPELRRLMAGGEEAARERQWLRETLYADIHYVLTQQLGVRRVLDIGCGPGDLLAYLREVRLDAVGIEPSAEAANLARERGLTVHQVTLEEFVHRHRSNDAEVFDAAVLINVLEHVPAPAQIIALVKEILRPGGIVCLRVPNDFNRLQLIAAEALGKPRWWIAIPDHINYFDFESLRRFLERLGFELVHMQGDFPMEVFLLMGDDYVGNPDVGARCHWRRVRFEHSLPSDLRRQIYQSLARIGIGRDCLVGGVLRP